MKQLVKKRRKTPFQAIFSSSEKPARLREMLGVAEPLLGKNLHPTLIVSEG
jgi:hypothetical protein